MPQTAKEVEDQAIDIATKHLQKLGYSVENVSRNRAHPGYDLFAVKAGAESLKIEVKGCARPWGIPDPYVTEFDANKNLIADYLYVVYLLSGESPKLCAIPRSELKAEDVQPKAGYRISSRFKKKNVLEKFVQPL